MQRARPAHLQAIEASLLGILDRILSGSVSQRRCFDKRTEKVMSTVLECLRRDGQIHVVALARAAGVSERTLHRLFWKYFHMGPKRYSKIRQLNLVRRAIRRNHATPVSVTGILTEHGVTEFGRFAIEYKALFNKSPAETLHKHLVPQSNGYNLSYERMSWLLGNILPVPNRIARPTISVRTWRNRERQGKLWQNTDACPILHRRLIFFHLNTKSTVHLED